MAAPAAPRVAARHNVRYDLAVAKSDVKGDPSSIADSTMADSSLADSSIADSSMTGNVADRSVPVAATDVGDRLLLAAAEVFAEEGYDRAGVAAIASRAGVTTGAIYHRFSGKADLLIEAVRVHCVGLLETILSPSVDGTGVGDTASRLAAAGSTLSSDGLSLGRALLLEAIVAARRDPDLREVLVARMDQRRELIGGVVEAARGEGAIDPALDKEALVHFAHAVALGVLLMDAIGMNTSSELEWAKVIDRVIDGLRPTSQGPYHAGESK